ncbi:unnamed protein product [Ectocarpus sp. CCAP 1310/34]|nr:unnamed protein product [Ectocarpus sp. CCAP 1310/34]
MFGDLAVLLSTVGVAPSTHATYAAAWKLWVEWRTVAVRKSVYLDEARGEEVLASELAKYMAYLFFCRGNKMSTIAGKLVAVKYYHKRIGVDLPMKHHFFRAVKAGLARESTLHTESRMRRPISWTILRSGIRTAAAWGEGGRVLWLGLAVSYFFMCRPSEIFAYGNGKIHKEFGITRGNVAFWKGEQQLLTPALWRCADRVDVLFEASKSNHDEAVVSRVKTCPGLAAFDWEWDGTGEVPKGMVGVGGFEVLLELMCCFPQLDAMAPITAYPSGQVWKVWTCAQSSSALRDLVAGQGLKPEEYAPHSGRIGGATRLGAMGLSSWAIQQQGRWKSSAFQSYLRANLDDVQKASFALASDAAGKGIQPGQKTRWQGGRLGAR